MSAGREEKVWMLDSAPCLFLRLHQHVPRVLLVDTGTRTFGPVRGLPQQAQLLKGGRRFGGVTH